MAVRTILHYPDPAAAAGQEGQGDFTELQQLIDDMAETMYAAPGCGPGGDSSGRALADFRRRLRGRGEPSDLRVFVNPQILSTEGAVASTRGA